MLNANKDVQNSAGSGTSQRHHQPGAREQAAAQSAQRVRDCVQPARSACAGRGSQGAALMPQLPQAVDQWRNGSHGSVNSRGSPGRPRRAHAAYAPGARPRGSARRAPPPLHDALRRVVDAGHDAQRERSPRPRLVAQGHGVVRQVGRPRSRAGRRPSCAAARLALDRADAARTWGSPSVMRCSLAHLGPRHAGRARSAGAGRSRPRAPGPGSRPAPPIPCAAPPGRRRSSGPSSFVLTCTISSTCSQATQLAAPEISRILPSKARCAPGARAKIRCGPRLGSSLPGPTRTLGAMRRPIWP